VINMIKCEMNVTNSAGGQTMIFINKLIISPPNAAYYEPSLGQKLKRMFGLSDYVKDTRSALDQMGFESVPMATKALKGKTLLTDKNGDQ